MKQLICLAALVLTTALGQAAAGVAAASNILYKAGASLSDYEKERCRLDLYLPAQRPGFATLVWFHGGARGRKRLLRRAAPRRWAPAGHRQMHP